MRPSNIRKSVSAFLIAAVVATPTSFLRPTGCPAVRRGGSLRRLVASCWGRMSRIGGAYSYALLGHARARNILARPFDQRVFFAGEATHPSDFSTAHGAYASGLRAAQEAVAVLAPN